MALILGLISSLGLAPYYIFYLTVVALVLCLFLLEKIKHPKEAFYIGFLYGFGFHIFGLYWIAISFKTANFGGYFLGATAVFLLCFFLAFFSAFSLFIIKRFSDNRSLFSQSILIVFILSLCDWIKGNIFWGFPWTPISIIWAFDEKTLAPFSFLGVWGYSLITYALITAIYLISKNIKIAILAFIPFFLSIVSSNLFKNNNLINIETLNIRLVQPNIKQIEKWDNKKASKNLNHLISLSLKNKPNNTDLIIWPETAVTFDMKKNSKEKIYFDKKTRNIDNLIVGAVRTEQSSYKSIIYNSLFLKKQNIDQVQYHDKLKLVPFGEYIPFRNFLNRKNFPLGGIDFSRGNNIKIFQLKDKLKVLPLICYEVIFPEITKKYRDNYNLLVNITNDAWFGKSNGPYQHLALSRVRAVLEGKYLLRVANTGITAIIDHDGKVIDKLDLNQTGVIDKKLVLSKKNTLYSYFGNGIFYILLIILFLIFCFNNYKLRLNNKNE